MHETMKTRPRRVALRSLLAGWATAAALAIGAGIAPLAAGAVTLDPLSCLIEPFQTVKLSTPVAGVLAEVAVDRGDLVVGPITLDDGATLQVRAGMSPHSRIGAGAELTALSVINTGQEIPPGELWSGVPAKRVGMVQPVPALTVQGRRLSPFAWDSAVFLGEALVGGLIALPAQLAGLAAMHFAGIDYDALWHWFYNPVLDSKVAAVMIGWTVLGLPLTLAWTAVLIRLMGPVKAGVHDRWSLPFLRAWLKSGLLTLSGEWLTGTMFWRGWLRLPGRC